MGMWPEAAMDAMHGKFTTAMAALLLVSSVATGPTHTTYSFNMGGDGEFFCNGILFKS